MVMAAELLLRFPRLVLDHKPRVLLSLDHFRRLFDRFSCVGCDFGCCFLLLKYSRVVSVLTVVLLIQTSKQLFFGILGLLLPRFELFALSLSQPVCNC